MVDQMKQKDKAREGWCLMKKSELRDAFHAAGMRLTRQRLAIFRELESRYDHPDVEHLFHAVKPRIPHPGGYFVILLLQIRLFKIILLIRTDKFFLPKRFNSDLFFVGM